MLKTHRARRGIAGRRLYPGGICRYACACEANHWEGETMSDETAGQQGRKMMQIIYICYAVSIVFGFTSLIGVVLAYLNKADAAGDWVESHYTWMIRTFWIGLLFGVVGMATMPIFIGILIILATVVWYVIRIAKGWTQFSKNQPIDDPESWLFG